LPSVIGGILDEKLAVRRSFGQDLLQRLRKDLTAQSDQITDELKQFIREARTDEDANLHCGIRGEANIFQLR